MEPNGTYGTWSPRCRGHSHEGRHSVFAAAALRRAAIRSRRGVPTPAGQSLPAAGSDATASATSSWPARGPSPLGRPTAVLGEDLVWGRSSNRESASRDGDGYGRAGSYARSASGCGEQSRGDSACSEPSAETSAVSPRASSQNDAGGSHPTGGASLLHFGTLVPRRGAFPSSGAEMRPGRCGSPDGSSVSWALSFGRNQSSLPALTVQHG